MPTTWLSWRRSLACKTQPGEVHDPQLVHEAPSRAKVEAAVFVSRKVYLRSGCSRSIANLRDVIHSSRRIDGARVPAMANFSPKSVESNDFVQSIPHEMLLQEQGCGHHAHCKHPTQTSLQGKLVSLDDIVTNHHPHPHHRQHQTCNDSMENVTDRGVASGSFYGTPLHPSVRANVHPDTPLHPAAEAAPKSSNSFRKFSGCYDCKNPAVSLVVYKTSSVGASAVDTRNGNGVTGVQGGASHPVAVPKAVCQRCGEAFFKYEALEQHHVLKHAVAELEVGDSSRNVVEIIFRTSWLRVPETSMPASTSANGSGGGVQQPKIVRVLKVNNLARTLARFEDYREGVKMRASKLPKKHPRCLADGNELLRFYGARLECELYAQQAAKAAGAEVDGETAGNSPVAAACASATCAICKIIRKGFPKCRAGAEGRAGCQGILTTATSGRAHQLLMADCGGGDEGAAGSARFIGTEQGFARSSSAGGACPKAAPVGQNQLDRADDHGARSRRQLQDSELGAGRRTSASGSRPAGRLMAMLVCRVIAGRVLKPQQQPNGSASAAATPPHSGDLGPPPGPGFDSVAGGELDLPPAPAAGTHLNMGLHSRFEELAVFNPRAILPCFVVLYRY